ncbi:hypothetical protein [Umezawaea beigongshangensis]|uniref:hypothetical protein n=1 Tax=Umezawaea beigongshangensis TaxID=2780383 RepID=UPI0018F20C35|nr:hypothetical protein [Umezawaea beigongshangensis]
MTRSTSKPKRRFTPADRRAYNAAAAQQLRVDADRAEAAGTRPVEVIAAWRASADRYAAALERSSAA